MLVKPISKACFKESPGINTVGPQPRYYGPNGELGGLGEECSSTRRRASRGRDRAPAAGRRPDRGGSGSEAQWRHLVAGARAALGAGSGLRGRGGSAAPAPGRGLIWRSINCRPPPILADKPPQGAEEPRIRGPGGVQRDGKAPSLRNPTLKMPLEFTLFITFINIVILFPACRALIRNVGACTPRLVQMGRPGPGEETPTASTRPALDGRGPHPGHSRGFEGSPAGLPDVARPLGRGPFRAGGGSGKAGSSGISLHKGKGGRSPGLGAGMGAPGEGRGSPQRGPGQRGHSPGKADARGPERRPLKKGSGVRQVGTLRSLR